MAPFFEKLRRRFRRDFGMEITAQGLNDSAVQQKVSILLPHVARRMGKQAAKVRKCLKNVILDEMLRLNGCTMSDDQWATYEIRLSTGLLLFHHVMVKLFVSRMTVVGDANEVVDETRISDDEMLSTAQRLMQAFWEKGKSTKHFFRTRGLSLMDLTKSQIDLAANLLHYADTFVVAHEFGHILMNVAAERVRRETLIAQAAKESMLQPALAQHKGYGDTALRNWTKEIAADLIGVNLCRELSDSDVVRMVIHGSAMMSLVMCDMLEKYYRKVIGKALESNTHPPSSLRLDVLETLSDASPGQGLGGGFRQFSDHIIARI
jgi:hypothetical protein